MGHALRTKFSLYIVSKNQDNKFYHGQKSVNCARILKQGFGSVCVNNFPALDENVEENIRNKLFG